jgi:hypothetical protein
MQTPLQKLRQWTLWWRNPRLRVAVCVLLWGLALISVIQGFRNAARFSTDFQWSPTVLLSAGVNPYQVALAGNPEGKILLSQLPPYLHLLYIVMLPLAYLPYTPAKLIWAILNFGFACASLVMLTRVFRLSALQGALLAAVFLLSTPYRNTVGNGQTSLLCLLTFLIAWIYQSRNEAGAGISLGLMLTKYSFAPAIFLWFLVKGKLAMLLVSVVCLTAGWLTFSWICHENPFATLRQPLKVASLFSESEGGGDIMTLLQSFGLDRPVLGGLQLSAIVGIVTSCLGVAALRLKAVRLTEPECLAALCLLSLLAIRHLAYDFVFAAPVAALAFCLPRLSQACVMAALAYLWFGLKLLTSMDISGKWVEALSFLALSLMLLIVLFAQRRTPSPSAVSAGDIDG